MSNAKGIRGRPFEKGNKLGRGRPPGSRNAATLALEALMEGEGETLTRKCIELAKAGDMTALRLCLERIYPVRKGWPVAVELPPVETAADVLAAHAVIIQEMAAGNLTPEEGAAFIAALESKRKAIETVDIEQRLAAIEAAQQVGRQR